MDERRIVKEFKVWGGKVEKKDALHIWATDSDRALYVGRCEEPSVNATQWTGQTWHYTVRDAEREILEAIANGEGGVYSFINDLRRSKDITKEEALYLMEKYVDGIPTF